MSALLFALALLLAEDPLGDVLAAPPAEPQAAAASEAAPELPYPPGAPHDDYGLVAWCYGTLRGYLDLHDEAMPEVTRIETTFRRPGARLADDLKVYADLQREGRSNLKLFARAMEAAERASLQPINAIGAEAVRKGRSTWAAAPNMTKAHVAQEWMSWALPARCVPTAQALEQRAKLQGPAFRVNEPPPEPAAPSETAPAPEAPVDQVSQAPAEPATEPATP